VSFTYNKTCSFASHQESHPNTDHNEGGYLDQKEPAILVHSEVILHPTTVHGLPANSVAKLLAPKPALCGQDLEVTINDLTFLGHPVKFDMRALDGSEVGMS
jgi:hypothetical protein